jgi:hypothetical protein
MRQRLHIARGPPAAVIAVSAFASTGLGLVTARQVAIGDPLSAVARLVGQEAAVGMLYVAIGTMLLRFVEAESRRRATLHTA